METSLINLLCSTPSCQVQPGSTSPQGKGADTSSFLTLLQGSLNGGCQAPEPGTVIEKLSDGKHLSSADALSRSLDIIDALAFLPVLLTAQPRMDNDPEANAGTTSYSADTIEGLLDAIANALETGNVDDLKKTLEENKGLQDLLSGQTTGAPQNLLAAQGTGSTDPAAGKDCIARDSRQGENSVGNAVASLIAALDANDDGQPPAGLASAIPDDVTQRSAAQQDENSVGNAVASLIAALDAVYARASEESLPSAPEKETPGVPTSKGKETSALPGRPGKEDAGSRSNAAGNEDVVRNTMLLGAILPNLLTVKPDAATTDSGSSKAAPNDVSQEFLSSIVLAAADNVQGLKQESATNETKRSGGQSAPREANQVSGTNDLSEDYVLLNTTKKDQAADAVPVSGKAFEVLYAKAEGTGTEQPSASQKGDVHDQKNSAVAVHASEKQTEAAKIEPPTSGKTYMEKAELLDSTKNGNPLTDLKDREEKSSHGDVKVEASDGKENVNVLTHDSAKTAASPQKSTATAQAAAPQASAMIHKIEELAERYSAKNQSMDMVLRLNVDEKESLIVGLRSQGDKVLVEVKGASDGLMSVLQSQKDVITRELESKHIYTTINVEINGDDSSHGRNQRERQKRDRNENEKEDFRGILDTLA